MLLTAALPSVFMTIMGRMTENGVSTCKAGEERYEEFMLGIGRRRRKMVQYDYRTEDGRLFSTVKPTLKSCREERDRWLNSRGSF